MNLVILSGRLDDEMEVDIADGRTRTRFSLFCKTRVPTKEGSEERVQWTWVFAYGPLAEELRFLGPSSEIVVRGYLDSERYDHPLLHLAYNVVVAESAEIVLAQGSS